MFSPLLIEPAAERGVQNINKCVLMFLRGVGFSKTFPDALTKQIRMFSSTFGSFFFGDERKMFAALIIAFCVQGYLFI